MSTYSRHSDGLSDYSDNDSPGKLSVKLPSRDPGVRDRRPHSDDFPETHVSSPVSSPVATLNFPSPDKVSSTMSHESFPDNNIFSLQVRGLGF